MDVIQSQEFLNPIVLSLQVSIVASVLVFIVGMMAAWWMSFKRFHGKSIVETLFMLPLVLPPTVVGFILLVALGRKSTIGKLWESIVSQPIVFTLTGAVIASMVVSFPLVYRTLRVGFDLLDRQLLDSARSYGANEWQVFRYIAIPLTARSMLSGFTLGFARSLGEFGATLMIAGSIPGRTLTVPSAIYLAVESGDMRLAWLWVLSIVVISFITMYAVNRKT